MDCNYYAESSDIDYPATLKPAKGSVTLNCSDIGQINGTNYLDFLNDDEFLRYLLRQSLFTHKSPSTIVLIVLYVLSFVTGVVGNVLVIVVWFKNKHIQTVINFFLVNLAVCDLMVILFCMPITLGNVIYNEWIYGEVLCKLTPCIQGMSVSSSVLILTAVSLNRFYAIHKPLKARVLYTRPRVRNSIIVIWIISLILMIPILIVNRLETISIPEFALVEVTSCTEKWNPIELKHAYNVFLFLVQFAIPMAFMFVAYAMIVKALVAGKAELGKDCNPDKQLAAQEKNRSKVVRLLMVVVVLFAVSWFPYHVATIWFDYKSIEASGTFSVTVFPFLQWLGLCNSSLNPICYCFLSKTYRRTFKASLQCRWERMQSVKNGIEGGHFGHSVGVGSSRRKPRKGISSANTCSIKATNRRCSRPKRNGNGTFQTKTGNSQHSKEVVLLETTL
ncbi:QRFP-like peptide receptor [Ptychodera flava]|uniref:QRFP-like peptide receptor n=1 Tax=Ptychodera flava TaxID=63121 RepID=UPI00396A07AE